MQRGHGATPDDAGKEPDMAKKSTPRNGDGRGRADDAPGRADMAERQGEFNELTQRLGERVKQYRARRGMSRKVLSQQSGVSERYLAQLESGQANVSFNILWNLAVTMNTSVTDLLQDHAIESPDLILAKRLLENLTPEEQSTAYALLRQRFGGAETTTGRVALIGLRGAGKTTLGKLLARHFDVPFIRITTMVEQMAGMDLPEIFLTMGQKGYRRLEYNALQAAISDHEHAVIEAGGSLVSEPETFDLFLNSCFTVWIKASPEEHMRRVMEQGDMRPMEGHQRAMEDLKTILESRKSFYGRADAALDTSGRTVEDCGEELVRMATPFLTKSDSGGNSGSGAKAAQ